MGTSPPPPSARPPEEIDAGEVVLLRWRAEHLDALHRAVAESLDHLSGWLVWAADPRREAQADFLESSSVAWDRGERFEYGVFDPQGPIVGSVGLMRRVGPGGLEIGYWVHAKRTRRGIAALATSAVTEAAFALSAVSHVEVHHDAANEASRAVPAALGFSEIETIAVAPRGAPLETGRDVIWRLQRVDYLRSRCPRLLERARAAAVHERVE